MTSRRAQHPWIRAAARAYVRRQLWREFDGVYVQGLAQVRTLLQREPLIIAATHASWWDALLALHLDALLGGQGGHCLMDADNLAQHAYFGLIGALPLTRSRPRQALVDMRAAQDLVRAPGQTLWIFPQGRQRPAHLRPLSLQPGVRWLGRASGARVVPLSLAYVYREAPKPSIAASFGAPIAGRDVSLLASLEAELVSGLVRVDRFVEQRDESFEAVVPSRFARGKDVPLLGRALQRLLRGHARGALGAGRALP